MGKSWSEVTGGTRRVPKIDIRALEKSFGTKMAVNGVDLVVEPGQFLVLLGPSGSGKSTLLRCLAGIERPTGGTIRFDDLTVDGPGFHLPPERRNLAVVFQDYALWPHLSAERNVAFALQRLGVSSDERRRRSLQMLEQVGLGGLSKRYPSQLSGGEQQRVGLARALVADPGILLLDEPLSNLDADRRERLRVDIGAMVRSRGATAVYITHDQAEAFALADVVGVLNTGKIVQVGSPEDIYGSPVDSFVARFTGLAGELQGRVVADGRAAQDGRVAIDVAGSVIYGKALRGVVLKSGQRVQLLVRPSALSFVDRDGSDEESDLQPTHSSRSRIEVTVLDAAFRGWGYEHVVSVGNGSHLGGVPASKRVPFMSKVLLELSSEGCLAVGLEREEVRFNGESAQSNERVDEWEDLQVLPMGSEF